MQQKDSMKSVAGVRPIRVASKIFFKKFQVFP